MIFMSLRINISKMEEIFKLFYDFSGIRIVVIDENFHELLAYPKEKCPFCREIHSKPKLSAICDQCDYNSYYECQKRQSLYIYKCHIGLIEATIPLMHYDKIIGYVMFGQITDIKDKGELFDFVNQVNETYNTHCTVKGLKYRSEKQISAAEKLLEICTDYIISKELAAPENSDTVLRAREYILEHLSEDISISDICRYVNLGRTELYRAFSAEYGMGIAAYIKKKRLSHAYNLIKTTVLPISAVSDLSGFYDYNYFGRIFKKEYGISPTQMRKSTHKSDIKQKL